MAQERNTCCFRLLFIWNLSWAVFGLWHVLWQMYLLVSIQWMFVIWSLQNMHIYCGGRWLINREDTGLALKDHDVYVNVYYVGLFLVESKITNLWQPKLNKRI